MTWLSYLRPRRLGYDKGKCEIPLEWAGMSIGNEGNPLPWSQYNGATGSNYTYVTEHGGSILATTAPLGTRPLKFSIIRTDTLDK
jgi:hypothetical protein